MNELKAFTMHTSMFTHYQHLIDSFVKDFYKPAEIKYIYGIACNDTACVQPINEVASLEVHNVVQDTALVLQVEQYLVDQLVDIYGEKCKNNLTKHENNGRTLTPNQTVYFLVFYQLL